MGVPLAELVAEIVPQAGEHAAPFCVRFQVTPLLLTSFETAAVKLCVPFTGTFANVGEIETDTPWTVITAEADWVESTTEVAVSVTVAGVGTLFGAV